MGKGNRAEEVRFFVEEAIESQGVPPFNFRYGRADRAEEMALERKSKEALRTKLLNELAALERELEPA